MSRNRAQTEQKILDAAIVVWSKHGFHGSSVRMIADEAKSNVSLINRYFGNKEGLLLALVEQTILEKQSGHLNYEPQDSLGLEVLSYLRFRYKQDLEMLQSFRIIISEITINEAFRNKAFQSLEYGADRNFMDRLSALEKNKNLKAGVSTKQIFRMISLFSFSSFYVEKALLNMNEHETDVLFQDFSDMIEQVYGVKGHQ